MVGRLEGVEIFATGVHHGSESMNVSGDDLDAMVASFDALGTMDGYKPVLKLGHEDVQKYFGQEKGAPNLGIVEKIWREGNKILANFANVPDAVVELIKMGRYNTVSIEMFPKAEVEGKTFSNVLAAVALLGAELPAVKGLKDLAASLFSDEVYAFDGDVVTLQFGEGDMPATYTKEQLDELVAASVAKALEAQKAEFDAKVTEAESKVAEAIEGQKTAEKALKEFEASSRQREVEALVDGAIEKGRMLPKHRDMALAFASAMKAKVKFGDGEKSSSELFKEFIESLPEKVDFSERGAGEGEKVSFSSVSEEVDVKARAKMAADKISYADARRALLDADADLKQRYFNMED